MKIIEMCHLLGIHEEAQEKIIECEKSINFSAVELELEQMKSPDRDSWEGALQRLKDSLGTDEDGMKILTCQLKCVCDTYRNYEAMGIDQEIFIATMKFFTRFLQDYKDKHGSYHYVWAWWAVRQISMVEFRIGELEYELKIEKGQHLIDIHIPADADMAMDKLRKSYLEAVAFFEKYYPDYKGADMVCNSWLLAPSLKYVLSENSRIIQFQKSFDIGTSEEDSTGFMDWVYGRKDIPIEELPEATSLQRNIKQHLLNKGKIEWTAGKLKNNPFCD